MKDSLIKCPKCHSYMTKGRVLAHGQFRLGKFSGNIFKFLIPSSKVIPFICPECGFVEWYADKQEIFRDGN